MSLFPRSLLQGALAALLAGLLAGCQRTPPVARDSRPTEVIVTTPVTAEVTDYQDFTGRLEAVQTVEIRARVSGYVNAVPFKEGDLVREGDLLFAIDPRPYQNQLDAAKPQAATAEANLKLAQIT